MADQSLDLLVFEDFYVDRNAGEIRRGGRKLRLDEKAFRVLVALLERPGKVVTRSALKQRLWHEGVVVEFEKNINNAVARLRKALGDSTNPPRYIETLPRRGYRFIAPLGRPKPAVPATSQGNQTDASHARLQVTERRASGRRKADLSITRLRVLVAILVAACIGLALRVGFEAANSTIPIRSLVVLPFDSTSIDNSDDPAFLAYTLTDALTTELSRFEELWVVSKTSARGYGDPRTPLSQIADELNVATVAEGTVIREGENLRVTVHLIDAVTSARLWSGSYRGPAPNLLALQQQITETVAREIFLALALRTAQAQGRRESTDGSGHFEGIEHLPAAH